MVCTKLARVIMLLGDTHTSCSPTKLASYLEYPPHLVVLTKEDHVQRTSVAKVKLLRRIKHCRRRLIACPSVTKIPADVEIPPIKRDNHC